jgi:hypothetical protein
MNLRELKEEDPTKGTYAAVKLSKNSTRALKEYIEQNNIPNPLRSDKMHITLLFSRRYCPNYEPRGRIDPPILAKAKNWDVFMTRPPEGEPTRCLVLKIKSPELFQRHLDLMNEHNATYDFLLYQPHVSLSYDIGDLDVFALPPYEGPLEIVEEYGEDLDLNWSADKGLKDNK